jgi:hypothetical protein
MSVACLLGRLPTGLARPQSTGSEAAILQARTRNSTSSGPPSRPLSVRSRLKTPEILSKQTVKDELVKSVNAEVTSRLWSSPATATSASAEMPCEKSLAPQRSDEERDVQDVFWSTHMCFDTVSICCDLSMSARNPRSRPNDMSPYPMDFELPTTKICSTWAVWKEQRVNTIVASTLHRLSESTGQ